MYFRKNGLDFAFDFNTLAIGLLICLTANTPSLAAGNTPITIVFFFICITKSQHEKPEQPGLAQYNRCFFVLEMSARIY